MKRKLSLAAFIIGIILTSLSIVIDCIDGNFEVVIFTAFILFYMGGLLYLGYNTNF